MSQTNGITSAKIVYVALHLQFIAQCKTIASTTNCHIRRNTFCSNFVISLLFSIHIFSWLLYGAFSQLHYLLLTYNMVYYILIHDTLG